MQSNYGIVYCNSIIGYSQTNHIWNFWVWNNAAKARHCSYTDYAAAKRPAIMTLERLRVITQKPEAKKHNKIFM